MMSLLTFYLTPHDYGLVQLASGIIKLFVVIISLGTAQYLMTKIYDVNYAEKLKVSFTSFISFSFLFSLGLSVIILFSVFFDFSFFNIPARHLWYLPLIAFLTVVYELFLNIYIFKEESKKFIVTSTLKLIAEFILIYLFVILLSYEWVGRIQALFISLIVSVLIYYRYFLKSSNLIGHTVSFKTFIEDSKKGFPLVLLGFSILVFDISDRFFLEKMLGLKATGMYSVAYTYTSMVLIVSAAITNGISPKVYQELGKRVFSIKKLLWLNLVLVLMVCFGVYLFKDFVFDYLFDQQYSDVRELVLSLAVGFFFWSLYVFFNSILVYYNCNLLVAKISFVGILINLLLNYLLIKWWGIIGACYATMFSCLFLLISSVYFSYKFMHKARQEKRIAS